MRGWYLDLVFLNYKLFLKYFIWIIYIYSHLYLILQLFNYIFNLIIKYIFTDTVKVGKNIRSHININKNCTMNYKLFYFEVFHLNYLY